MPDDTAEQHDWGLTQYQGAKMLAKYLWPQLVDSARNEVRDKFRAMLVESYRLYRPDDGGFAYYAADANADIDGTGLALGVLQVLGVMPGTWERERLWGKVSEAGLTATRLRVPSWAQATLPPSPNVQSFRVYRDRLQGYDDANLVRIVYPPGANGLDIMDVRQGLAKFMHADGHAFGNWKSKVSLKDTPLGLDRDVKRVQVTREGFDLAGIARDYPASGRFYVVGYDIVQVPVVVIEVVKAER